MFKTNATNRVYTNFIFFIIAKVIGVPFSKSIIDRYQEALYEKIFLFLMVVIVYKNK